MPPRVAALAALATTQVVAVVLAHELVFLARYGSRYGEALVHAGHGESWSSAVMLVLALGLALGGSAAVRLAYLAAAVRRSAFGATSHEALEVKSLLRAWLRFAVVMSVLTVGLLTVQENVEHGASGLATAGAGILLTPEYAGGLWIALGVGAVVAFVVALFDWHRRVLLARLRASRSGPARTPATSSRSPGMLVDPPHASILGRKSALRAPPLTGTT